MAGPGRQCNQQRGVKIHTEALEEKIGHILHHLGIINRYLIAPLPHKQLGQQVVLILEGAPLSEAQQQKIQAAFKAQLNRYQIPKQILYLPHFAETPTGKVQRAQTVKLLFLDKK